LDLDTDRTLNLQSLASLAFGGMRAVSTPVACQTNAATPLRFGDAVRLATSRRAEIEAARAHTRTGEARPTIVSGA
jgi:hypothetical protein